MRRPRAAIPSRRRPNDVSAVTIEHDEFEKTDGRRAGFGAALTIAALVASALIAVLLVLGYAEGERNHEMRAWQDRLGVIADARTRAVEDWLRRRRGTLAALAGNTAVRLYMTELSAAHEGAAPPGEDLARAGYLRNLLAVLAQRDGFSAVPDGPEVGADVPRAGGAGLALLDISGRMVAASPDMPAFTDRIAEFIGAADAGRPSLLDLHPGARQVPTMAFLVPVYAVQGDPTAENRVGWALGVAEVGDGLFDLLRQPGAPWDSAEALLVRRDAAAVTYLAPTEGGADALVRRLAFDTPDLAAAYAIEHHGGFAMKRDYRGAPVLLAARAVDGAPWTLLYKIDADEALGPAAARLDALLIGIVLATIIAVAAFIAVWRHGASRRAAFAAARFRTLFRRHEAQGRLLRSVADCQNAPMYLLDSEGRFAFANRAASARAGVDPEDLLGKTVDGVFGPVHGRRVRDRNRIAEAGGPLRDEFRDTAPDGSVCAIASEHVPIDDVPGVGSGVMVIEHDITDVVTERERRLRLRDRLIETLLTVVDRRDPYAASHSAQVAAVARGIAEEMGLDAADVETAATAGRLMNLGKILVPRALLCTADDLESYELRAIRESVRASADLLDDVEFDGPVVETLRQIQERWDGTGEPAGLRGGDILLPARIVAVANAFVAMTSPRAWRPGLSVDDAVAQLMAGIGAAFDRRVVAALVNRLDNRDGRAIWVGGRTSAA